MPQTKLDLEPVIQNWNTKIENIADNKYTYNNYIPHVESTAQSEQDNQQQTLPFKQRYLQQQDNQEYPFTLSEIQKELSTLVDKSTTLSSSDWEPGDVCPVCTSANIFKIRVHTEIATHQHNTSSLKGGGPTEGVLSLTCADCEHLYRVSPAYLLLLMELPSLSSEIDMSIHSFPALNWLSEQNIEKEKQSYGNVCPHCEHNKREEYIIDTDYSTIKEQEKGTYSYGGYVDRLYKPQHKCTSCEEILIATPLTPFYIELSLPTSFLIA